MAYADVITALADPTRRSIFEALRGRPRSVGELARRQPVSRPAVSQHLRVLESAKLVGVESSGNRRVYWIRREGLESLRAYLESFWDDVLEAYGAEIRRRVQREHARQVAATRHERRSRRRPTTRRDP